MRKRLIVAAASMSAVLILAGLGGSFAWRNLNAPMSIEAPRTFLDVPFGTPLRHVSAELAERGILRYPRLLTGYARLTGAATRIYAGEYELRPGMTPLALLEQLLAGHVYMHQLTIIEGWRFSDLLHAVRANPAIAVTTLDGPAIMTELGEAGVHPEGQFLPDTYTFPKGTTDIDLLRWAHAALQEKLAEAWANRSPDVQLASPYQALVLASIIEKETALPMERGLIAGVFNERLKRGMRLQTDPTVIYGMGDVYDGDLRSSDLANDTPYNTYTRAGLPPTPIALPSAASIDAAVRPEQTDALYFVATGRPDGSHYFSATLAEHNQAVHRYLDTLHSAPQ